MKSGKVISLPRKTCSRRRIFSERFLFCENAGTLISRKLLPAYSDFIVHDKSSLAPEGKPVAFCLDPETGFSWIGEYDITADELLSGAGGNTATKTEQAERLILDLLADGKELASEDIVKAAAEAGISERTVQNAKRSMGGILGARRVGGQWYNFIKKKQPPEPAS